MHADLRRPGRERRTVAAMLAAFCRAHHADAGSPPSPDGGGAASHRGALCPECRWLLAYVDRRLERCVWGRRKPVCAKCPVHCYAPEPRERVREVMRWAGPRMLLRHPVLALWHWVDARREVPARPSRQGSGTSGG